VLISIVCGLGWLLAYKGSNSISDLKRELDAAKDAAQKATTAIASRVDEIKRLKDKLGSKFEDVGTDDSNPNTVLGDMRQHMTNYGQGLTDPTYNGLIVKQNQALRDTIKARDKLQEDLQTELKQFEQTLAQKSAELATEKTARETADKDKTNADSTHKEELAKKNADLAEYRREFASLQAEYDEYKAGAEKGKKDADTRISALLTINKKLAAELDEKTRVSFDQPDGFIRWIDPIGKKVWISLGEAEGVKPRTTFSVYRKTNSGVGRGTQKGSVGAEDIKGSIEVTKVMEAHLSEARILTEDIYRPMAKGDPIYSPLWSSTHDEAFSIVGIVDLDGDGKDDRDLFREIVATAGATIDNDVDDKGVLRVNGKIEDKPKITERTKFLVIGKIPEIAESADPDEIATIQKILAYRKDLQDAATERGVRVVSMGDFLNYIGYKSQRRLFVPGSDVPYNLKSGSHSTGVGDASGSSRTSSGSTSGAYSGDKAVKARSNSADGSSKVFRGGK
jgi:hypothetical protein